MDDIVGAAQHGMVQCRFKCSTAAMFFHDRIILHFHACKNPGQHHFEGSHQECFEFSCTQRTTDVELKKGYLPTRRQSLSHPPLMSDPGPL